MTYSVITTPAAVMGTTTRVTSKKDRSRRIKDESTAVNLNTTIKQYPRWHDAASGAAAGVAARLVVAPLDIVKIRRQLDMVKVRTGIGTTSRGLLPSLRNIVRNEGGVKSLFRGNMAATCLWVGYAAVQFALYAQFSEFLLGYAVDMDNGSIGANPPTLPSSSSLSLEYSSLPQSPVSAVALLSTIASNPTYAAFASGAIAGVGATLVTYPLDVCRTVFAALPKSAPGAPRSIVGFFLGSSGAGSSFALKRLYSGCVPAVMGIIPYMGLNFALYDHLTRSTAEGGTGGIGAMGAGTAGMISGGASKIITYPLDTIKRRLQARALGGALSSSSLTPQYRGTMDCALQILTHEGPRSFYRGLVPTVIKSATATGVTFAVFQATKGALKGLHDGGVLRTPGRYQGSALEENEKKR